MASCLGISVGKNLIKYAKMSKDKGSGQTTIDAYGVKFYDILGQTMSEIIQETKSNDSNTSISVCLTSEDYEYTEVYRSVKPKERTQLIQSDFSDKCQSKSINASGLDMRYFLVDDITNPDQYKAICVAISKVELQNIWQALNTTKFESISSVGSSITSLLKDKGAGENCLIINIEDDTKCTIVKNGAIYQMLSVPVGMDEVIAKLADKYNSYARAYEACKGVDAYADADLSFDVEAQSIRDVLMPTLYELKQRLIMALEPYMNDFQEIYITGTGVIINNLDLYLSEAFQGKRLEILIPYFVNKERNSLKDVVEVNSALAAANYLLGGVKKDEDFLASGTYLKAEANKKNFTPKAIFGIVTAKIDEINKKTLKVKKSNKRKTNIVFDNEVENLQQLGGAGEFSAPQAEEEVEYYDPIAEWLARVAAGLFVGWVAYAIVVNFISGSINTKMAQVEKNIAASEAQIQLVDNDRSMISKKTNEYKDKTNKLQQIINTIRLRKERTYEVPNFMSQVMFIIPTEVKVTSYEIETDKTVTVHAESGKYAQLGYFVSRIKLAGLLADVNMEVESMTSNIQIKITGRLP